MHAEAIPEASRFRSVTPKERLNGLQTSEPSSVETRLRVLREDVVEDHDEPVEYAERGRASARLCSTVAGRVGTARARRGDGQRLPARAELVRGTCSGMRSSSAGSLSAACR